MKWILIILSLTMPTLANAAENGQDRSLYGDAEWSPYWVGAGIGVLSWFTFYFSNNPIGASSFYATVAGAIGKMVAPRHTERLSYFKSNPPTLGWSTVFVVSIIAGSAVAALTGDRFRNEWLPLMWHDRFGEGIFLRGSIAFAGGALMAFGARLAGGCTSGHGISRTLQLNVASWISVLCFFIGGIPVAMLLYHT